MGWDREDTGVGGSSPTVAVPPSAAGRTTTNEELEDMLESGKLAIFTDDVREASLSHGRGPQEDPRTQRGPQEDPRTQWGTQNPTRALGGP